jgi:hypothetical protein
LSGRLGDRNVLPNDGPPRWDRATLPFPDSEVRRERQSAGLAEAVHLVGLGNARVSAHSIRERWSWSLGPGARPWRCCHEGNLPAMVNATAQFAADRRTHSATSGHDALPETPPSPFPVLSATVTSTTVEESTCGRLPAAGRRRARILARGTAKIATAALAVFACVQASAQAPILFDGADGATCDYFNQGARVKWRHRQGDWSDARDAAQGDQPYAEILVRATDRDRSVGFDVTRLVQKASYFSTCRECRRA